MLEDFGRRRRTDEGEEERKGREGEPLCVVLHSASIKSSGRDALPVVIGGVDIKYVLAQVGGADL